MDKLPPEILMHVFKYLHFRQKLNCMAVCKSWLDVLIRNECISETLEIVPSLLIPNARMLYYLIERPDMKTISGKHCKRLWLNNGSFSMKNSLTTFAKHLPRLEFLFFRTGYRKQGTVDQRSFQNWQTSLKTVIDESRGGCMMLDMLSAGGTFTRLTTFILRFNGVPPALSNANMLRQLENMPQLSTFVTNMPQLSAEDLEVLHNSTPNLVSLSIQRYITLDLNRVRSLNISPADSVKTFEVTGPDESNSLHSLLLYATQKYTHLQEFAFIRQCSPGYRHRDDEMIEGATSAWTNFIAAVGGHLKTFKLQINYSLNHIIDQLLVYATKLEYLEFKIHDFDLFRTYDLTQSIFQCVTRLSMCNIPDISELSNLNHLTKLHELVLDYKFNTDNHFPFMFNNLVDVLPKNLRVLGVQSGRFSVDGNSISQDQSYITTLLFHYTSFDETISEYLTSSFPVLKSVVLYQCLYSNTSNILRLPSHHLNYAEITHSHCHASELVRVTSYYEFNTINGLKDVCLNLTRDNETYKYKTFLLRRAYGKQSDVSSANVHDHSLQSILKPCTDEETDSQDHFNIHFECASVQSFYYCGYLIL